MLLERRGFRSLCRAREMLCELDDPAPSIEALAKELAVSSSHFTRQFAALFGETPHQFRMRARLEHAKRLLAAGQHSVTGVCMEVGWSSLGSFSDLFTRRVGATPSEYRKRMRTLVQVPGALPRELVPGCFSLMARLPADAFRSFREA
jgi:AraC-like DNA-binding protein